MRVSIIVPVYNDSKNLSDCLSTLTTLSHRDSEIIVVDDGSTDDSPAVAAGMGLRVLTLPRNSGPAAARNYGARHAQGDVLFFVDSDVVLAPQALHRVEQGFAARPDLAAIFGSYDAQPKAPGIVSQYRNLLHHFVHQNGNPEASTFWAGCGAIRRSVFEQIGGFDEKRFPYPSIEDIELGYRLRQSGHRILLDKSLQCTHLKKWKLRSVIKTDVTGRAIPWSRLILETKKVPDDLNLKWGQRFSFVLVALACLAFTLALFRPALILASAAAFLGVALLNHKLYIFFFRQKGFFFTIACVPLHLLYYLYSGLSYMYVWSSFQLRKLAALPVRPRFGVED